jgi:hypothetical protein
MLNLYLVDRLIKYRKTSIKILKNAILILSLYFHKFLNDVLNYSDKK